MSARHPNLRIDMRRAPVMLVALSAAAIVAAGAIGPGEAHRAAAQQQPVASRGTR